MYFFFLDYYSFAFVIWLLMYWHIILLIMVMCIPYLLWARWKRAHVCSPHYFFIYYYLLFIISSLFSSVGRKSYILRRKVNIDRSMCLSMLGDVCKNIKKIILPKGGAVGAFESANFQRVPRMPCSTDSNKTCTQVCVSSCRTTRTLWLLTSDL